MTSTITAPAVTTASEVAKAFIKIANDEKVAIPETGETYVEGITNLKLQKMLYFADAAYLALYGKPLFDDEVQAWSLGPVVPSVYEAYKAFANAKLSTSEEPNIPTDINEFLSEMWAIFGKYTASELVDMSHKHAPWKDVYEAGRNNPISKESMMNYYRNTKAFSAK